MEVMIFVFSIGVIFGTIVAGISMYFYDKKGG